MSRCRVRGTSDGAADGTADGVADDGDGEVVAADVHDEAFAGAASSQLLPAPATPTSSLHVATRVLWPLTQSDQSLVCQL